MKPFYRYLGGKQKELKYFRDLIPESYDTYVEPFFGGGAVYWNLEPKKAILTDNDEGLINFLWFVKMMPELFNSVVKFWPCTKEYFLKIRDEWEYSGKEIEAQRYFYFLRTSFNGFLRYNDKKRKYNMSFGNKKSITPIPKENSDLLKTATLLCKDFREIFKDYDDEKNFFFLDPPYDGLYNYMSTVMDNSDTVCTIKDIEKFMRNCKSKVMLTVNATPFTEKLFEGFNIRKYKKFNSFGAHCKNKDTRLETLVVTNY